MQAQIAASLRHLKEAVAHLSDAALAIGDADKTASANIDHLASRARRNQAARTIELPAGLIGKFSEHNQIQHDLVSALAPCKRMCENGRAFAG